MSKMNKINYTDEGIEALAVAIMEVTAYDYQNELERLRPGEEPSLKLKRLDAFFDSELGQLCSFGQADFIRDQIRKGKKVVVSKYFDEYFEPVLTADDIKFIKTHYKRFDPRYNTVKLAKMFDVSVCTINSVLKGRI